MGYWAAESGAVARLDRLSERLGADPDERCTLDCLRTESLEMDATEQAERMRQALRQIAMGGPSLDSVRWRMVNLNPDIRDLTRGDMERIALDALHECGFESPAVKEQI